MAVTHTCTDSPITEAWDALLGNLDETRFSEASRKEKAVRGAIGSGLRKQRSLNNEAVARVVSMLRDARVEVTRAINSAGGFDAFYLPQLRGAVERVLRDFQAEYFRQFQELQIDIEDLATEFIAQPLTRTGVEISFPMLPQNITQTIANYHSDQITGLTNDAIDRITREINLSVMGGRSREEAVKGVARHLPGPSNAGTIGNRATRIIRTEVNRIHSMTAQVRMEQAREVVPDLRKYWLPAYRNTRPSHAQAGMVYGPPGIPTNEPFIVAGVRAMHPRDPNLPAAEVVNCQCFSIPVVPGA